MTFKLWRTPIYEFVKPGQSDENIRYAQTQGTVWSRNPEIWPICWIFLVILPLGTWIQAIMSQCKDTFHHKQRIHACMDVNVLHKSHCFNLLCVCVSQDTMKCSIKNRRKNNTYAIREGALWHLEEKNCLQWINKNLWVYLGNGDPAIELGPCLEQHVDDVDATLWAGMVEGRGVILVLAPQVSPRLDQHVGHLLVVVDGRLVESCHPLFVLGLHITHRQKWNSPSAGISI